MRVFKMLFAVALLFVFFGQSADASLSRYFDDPPPPNECETACQQQKEMAENSAWNQYFAEANLVWQTYSYCEGLAIDKYFACASMCPGAGILCYEACANEYNANSGICDSALNGALDGLAQNRDSQLQQAQTDYNSCFNNCNE
jgi:hypothetical protein